MLGDAADQNPRLANWRTERFHAQARKRLAVVGVDAAHQTRYLVYPNDKVIGAAILRKGAYDPEKIAVSLDLLRAEGITITQLLDIGANIGTTTIEVLRQLPDVTGVAFEPEPANFQLLRMNLIANGLDDRVKVHRVALSNEPGALTFELSGENNFGDHRVRMTNGNRGGEFGEEGWTTISVPAQRLDDVEGLEIDESTLLIMDVQGFEGHVLAGASRALGARPVVVLELWPYALDRAGGRELLFDSLTGYDRFFDINDPGHGPYAHRDLAELADRAQQRDRFGTDLLALPY
jgi:FkbM family methyltransferase